MSRSRKPRPPSEEEEDDQELQNLTPEERERFDYFQRACKFPDNRVYDLVRSKLPGSVHIQGKAVTAIADAARLFAATLTENARSLSTENGPLTPDLIFVAFDHLTRQGRIPNTAPVPGRLASNPG
jgi:hypothetical protein